MSVRRRTRLLRLCASISLATILAPPQHSHAATRSWTNPIGGSFNTITNWGGAAVPGPADTALFDLLVPPPTPSLSQLSSRFSTTIRSV